MSTDIRTLHWCHFYQFSALCTVDSHMVQSNQRRSCKSHSFLAWYVFEICD